MRSRHPHTPHGTEMFIPSNPHIGFQFKSRGWTIEVKGDREVSVTNPMQGLCDVAKLSDDGTVHYSKAEIVPRDVRTAVKILGRKMLARDLQF